MNTNPTPNPAATANAAAATTRIVSHADRIPYPVPTHTLWIDGGDGGIVEVSGKDKFRAIGGEPMVSLLKGITDEGLGDDATTQAKAIAQCIRNQQVDFWKFTPELPALPRYTNALMEALMDYNDSAKDEDDKEAMRQAVRDDFTELHAKPDGGIRRAVRAVRRWKNVAAVIIAECVYGNTAAAVVIEKIRTDVGRTDHNNQNIDHEYFPQGNLRDLFVAIRASANIPDITPEQEKVLRALVLKNGGLDNAVQNLQAGYIHARANISEDCL